MKKLDSRLKENKPLLYAVTICMGVGRTLIGFPLEHPFDSVKTQWQALPGKKNEFEIIKEIYRTKGLKGLYAGGMANILRGIIKNAYRFPALIAFPKIYSYLLPKKLSSDQAFMRGLTGLSIALSEVFLLNPLERLKVVSMTSSVSSFKYKRYLSEIKCNYSKELRRGCLPYFIRQAFTWVGFLEADVFFKLRTRKILGLKEADQIPLKPLFLVSLCVGLTTSFIYMPLDMIKTHLQLHGSKDSMIQALTKLVNQHGIKGLFTGWRVKTCQYMAISTVAVIVLEKLEYWAK